MTRTVTIDPRDEAQRAAFHAVWPLSDAEKKVYQDHAVYQAKRDRISREYGVAAVVAWQIAGVDPEASAQIGRAA